MINFVAVSELKGVWAGRVNARATEASRTTRTPPPPNHYRTPGRRHLSRAWPKPHAQQVDTPEGTETWQGNDGASKVVVSGIISAPGGASDICSVSSPDQLPAEQRAQACGDARSHLALGVDELVGGFLQ